MVNKAMITGKEEDQLTFKIINELENGLRVSEVPERYPISLDQAKRISRYKNMLIETKGKISPDAYKNLIHLGMKSLYLGSLFREGDWEGLNDILLSITSEVKRRDLTLLIEELHKKRQKNKDIQEEINILRNEFRRDIKLLESQLKRLNEQTKEINYIFDLINKYSVLVRKVFLDGVGFLKGKLVLMKIFNPDWLQTMLQDGIIKYDDQELGYIIVNTIGLLDFYENKVDNGTIINSFKAESVNLDVVNNMNLTGSLREAKESIKKEISNIKQQKKNIEQKLKNINQSKANIIIESKDIKHVLSLKEIELQRQLKNQGLKWLYNQEYAVVDDFTLPNKKIVDVIGYSKNGKVIVIDVKTSMKDWNNDKNWTETLKYCDEFYFLVNNEIYKKFNKGANSFWKDNERFRDAVGILVVDETNKLTLVEPSIGHMKIHHPTELLFEISMMTSGNYVLGL
ncbi:MmcB family DNA repair protein [Metabacillus niabensis]|uniref:MmcB family DNA repair protein n=1 Tax=Metabacillus niabensis TaxID=324854 RepID=UPI0039A0EE6E